MADQTVERAPLESHLEQVVRSRELLIVEDNPGDAVLIELLAEEAWPESVPSTTVVRSLAEARRHLTTASVDCILLDLTLPDASGLEAVAALGLSVPDVAIVVLTGMSARAMSMPALAEGAQEFLAKDELDVAGLRGAVDRACERKSADRRREEVRRQAKAVLHSVEAPTVALDGVGRIVACSEAWLRAASRSGVSATCGLGVDYLAVCDAAIGPMSDGAAEVAAGLRSVLAGESAHFSTDYACPDATGMRWFSVRVTPIEGGGAVVTHTDITDTKRAEEAMHFNASPLADGPEAAPPSIFCLVDRDGRVLHVAPHTRQAYGTDPGAPLPSEPFGVVHDHDRPLLMDAFQAALSGTEPQSVTVRYARATGGWSLLRLTITDLLDQPEVGAVIVAGEDISDRRRRAVSDHLDAALLDRLPTGVVVTDDVGVVVYANERAARLLGREPGSIDGLDLSAQFGRGRMPGAKGALRSEGRWEGESEIIRPDGTLQALYVVMEVVAAESIDFRGAVISLVDDSERRKLLASIAHRERHDELTGLPNEALLLERTTQALARRGDGEAVAVLSLELDQYALIGELGGREATDLVVQSVAQLLEMIAGPWNTVARVGPAAFAVCSERLADAYEAVVRAEQLTDVVAQPLRIADEALPLSFSVGIAVGQGERRTRATELLEDAHVALHRAKEQGAGGREVFDEAMRASLSRRVRLIEGLRNAVQRDELRVLFQPIVDFDCGVVVGAEALLRWEHPVDGLLAPCDFIGLAEETKLIVPIGEWVIDHAVAQAAEWRRRLPERRLVVSVNLSGHQLADPNLSAMVRATLDRHGLDPALLCLEITETVLMEDAEAAVATLRELRTTGVRLAIDDFGTGYSSLAYLKRLPVDYLKVDRSFVSSMETDPEDSVIVGAVVRLAASLGLSAVAEGVETERHAAMLAELGCAYGQGYLWSVPASSEKLLEMAAERHERTAVAQLTQPAASGGAADVASIIRHEIVTPLTVVRGSLELLAKSDLDEGQRRSVAAVLRGASRIEGLLSTIEDLQFIDTGRLVLDVEPFDVAALLAGVVSEFATVAPDRRIDVAVPAGTVALGDPSRVIQVVNNLLTNAHRFSPPDAPIEIRGEVTDPMVRVWVSDHGSGIPPDRVAEAFRKFAQLDHRGKGIGLGLYLSRAFARAQGGDLGYRRRPDAEPGACFVFSLPAYAPDQARS